MTQLEQMEAHVNGLAGTLVRVRFANGGSVLEVNDQARIALASAGRATVCKAKKAGREAPRSAIGFSRPFFL